MDCFSKPICVDTSLIIPVQSIFKFSLSLQTKLWNKIESEVSILCIESYKIIRFELFWDNWDNATYSVFQGFKQAKSANGGSILSLSQFLILPQLPQKMKLASKVVKVDANWRCFIVLWKKLSLISNKRGKTEIIFTRPYVLESFREQSLISYYRSRPLFPINVNIEKISLWPSWLANPFFVSNEFELF